MAAASQISRITFANVGKLKNFNLSAPLVIEAKDISNALKLVQSQLDGFSFYIGRKGKSGIRASKPIKDDDTTAA